MAIPTPHDRPTGAAGRFFRGTGDVHAVMRAWGRQQAALWGEGSRFFMEIDLTMAQFRALTTLRINGKLTGKDLARHLHVTPGTLIPMLDRLESQGYVRRVPDLHDRRLTWIELTDKSFRLFWRMWVGGHARMLRAVRQLPAAERVDFARLLNKIADLLS